MLYVVLGMPTLKMYFIVPRKCGASLVLFYCLQRDMPVVMILEILQYCKEISQIQLGSKNLYPNI